jgi:nicotinate-nucleotide adenylyltransferase
VGARALGDRVGHAEVCHAQVCHAQVGHAQVRHEGALTGPRVVVPGSRGVLGGTFDPIHIGHLAIAEEARETVGLERVLFVPAGQPPHKPGRPITPATDRLAMVALAIEDNPAFELSRAEVDRPGPSYAVDTLQSFADQARGSGRQRELVFIISDEALAGLPSWRNPRRLLELARLAVFPRGLVSGERGDQLRVDTAWVSEQFPGFEDRVAFLEGPRLAVSATQIRERIAAGRSVRYLVPPAVLAYITDHDLYTSDDRRTNRS